MRALLAALGAALFTAILVLSSLLLGVDLAEAAASLDAESLAVLAFLYVAGEAARGARLYLLLRAAAQGGLEARASLWRALMARLASNLVSVATPAVAGGELVRGVLACSRLGSGVVVAGMLDGAYDLFLNYALALLVAPWVLSEPTRRAYFVAAASLGLLPVAAWSSVLVLGLGIPRRLRKLVERLKPGLESALEEAARTVRASIRPRVQAVVISLSAVAWVLQGLQLWVASTRACCPPSTLLDAVAGMLVGSLMGVIPSPGGAGVLEAAASSFTCPKAAFTWRLAWLLLAVVVGAPSIAYLSLPLLSKRRRSS